MARTQIARLLTNLSQMLLIFGSFSRTLFFFLRNFCLEILYCQVTFRQLCSQLVELLLHKRKVCLECVHYRCLRLCNNNAQFFLGVARSHYTKGMYGICAQVVFAVCNNNAQLSNQVVHVWNVHRCLFAVWNNNAQLCQLCCVCLYTSGNTYHTQCFMHDIPLYHDRSTKLRLILSRRGTLCLFMSAHTQGHI